MNPILSVVVPSYNVEKYLDKCLTSFSDDRLKNRLQVMIVNDGSVDKTEEIANRYVEKYPAIFELINKENGGHGSAVNCGIKNARGKYFRIVDGDDWVNTDNLVKLIDILEKTDSDLVVDEKREVNFETGNTQFFPLPEYVETDKKINFEEVCAKDDLCGVYVMLHTLSVKTELLHKYDIRLLEGIFYVDIEYIIKSTAVAKTIEFHNLEIYKYLVGNANQSVNYKNYVKRFEHHKKVTREMVIFAVNFKGSPEYKEYVDRRVKLLINTHMNISLIFNEDRKQGLYQAKDFRTWLKSTAPEFYKSTTKRFYITLLLHYLGVDFNKLQRLKGNTK